MRDYLRGHCGKFAHCPPLGAEPYASVLPVTSRCHFIECRVQVRPIFTSKARALTLTLLCRQHTARIKSYFHVAVGLVEPYTAKKRADFRFELPSFVSGANG